LAYITLAIFRVNEAEGGCELVICRIMEVKKGLWIMVLCNQKGPYPHLTSTLSISFALKMMIAVYAKMLEQLQRK
jgi:hypothetical protein